MARLYLVFIYSFNVHTLPKKDIPCLWEVNITNNINLAFKLNLNIYTITLLIAYITQTVNFFVLRTLDFEMMSPLVVELRSNLRIRR